MLWREIRQGILRLTGHLHLRRQVGIGQRRVTADDVAGKAEIPPFHRQRQKRQAKRARGIHHRAFEHHTIAFYIVRQIRKGAVGAVLLQAAAAFGEFVERRAHIEQNPAIRFKAGIDRHPARMPARAGRGEHAVLALDPVGVRFHRRAFQHQRLRLDRAQPVIDHKPQAMAVMTEARGQHSDGRHILMQPQPGAGAVDRPAEAIGTGIGQSGAQRRGIREYVHRHEAGRVYLFRDHAPQLWTLCRKYSSLCGMTANFIQDESGGAAGFVLDSCAAIGQTVLHLFNTIGRLSLFVVQAILHVFTPPFFPRLFGRQIVDIGYYSLPVVGMTALFTGMVLALQSYTGFSRFNAESAIAAVVVLSVTRELAPVLAGLMVAGRVGASMAAEIGTMRVTEQIDALTTLSVNPYKYLIAPRLLAGTIMLPVLVLIGDIIGVFGGYVVSIYRLGFAPVSYLHETWDILETMDVVSGLTKAAMFGFVVAMMGCYHGFNSQRGAQGVGAATTYAVVSASILILISNYLLTQVFFS